MKVKIQDIEKTILSTFIFDHIFFEDNHSLLEPVDFYLPQHQEIFRVMLDLYQRDYPIDEDFILKYANKEKVKEFDIIQVLSSNAVSSPYVYLNEIKEASKKRKLDKLSIEIKKMTLDEMADSSDIMNKISKELDTIELSNNDKYEHSSTELLEQIKLQMESKSIDSKEIKYYTGLKSLDKILDGIDDGELVIIAARPSMGKTSLISSITIETLSKGRGVLIESLEMSADKIMKRFLSSRSGENLSDLKNGLIKNIDKFNEAIKFLSTDDLIIHDETYITFYQLQAKIKKVLRKNKNIRNIFIDHTGKVKLEGKTREDIEIGHITNGLKKIAREYGVRVFLLQQLNRTVETRENKRPILSDLKNSGNIEEDADLVLGLYRGSYYKSKENDTYENEQEDAEIIVLKNRDGSLGTAKVVFERKTSSFKNKVIIDRENIIKFKN